MVNISEFMASVYQFLSERQIEGKSVQQYQFSLPADIQFPGLDWLASQQFYPQFYWHHRDGHEEVALLGEVKHFTNIVDAEQFLQQQSATTTMPIWGLNVGSHCLIMNIMLALLVKIAIYSYCWSNFVIFRKGGY